MQNKKDDNSLWKFVKKGDWYGYRDKAYELNKMLYLQTKEEIKFFQVVDESIHGKNVRKRLFGWSVFWFFPFSFTCLSIKFGKDVLYVLGNVMPFFIIYIFLIFVHLESKFQLGKFMSLLGILPFMIFKILEGLCCSFLILVKNITKVPFAGAEAFLYLPRVFVAIFMIFSLYMEFCIYFYSWAKNYSFGNLYICLSCLILAGAFIAFGCCENLKSIDNTNKKLFYISAFMLMFLEFFGGMDLYIHGVFLPKIVFCNTLFVLSVFVMERLFCDTCKDILRQQPNHEPTPLI